MLRRASYGQPGDQLPVGRGGQVAPELERRQRAVAQDLIGGFFFKVQIGQDDKHGFLRQAVIACVARAL